MHKGFILLNCDLGAEEYIVDQLKQMTIIDNAYLTFGAYDVIAEIETEDQEGFEKVVAIIRKLIGRFCVNSNKVFIKPRSNKN